MNLRQDQKSLKQLTLNLWKTRVANIYTRKNLEADIDSNNYNIAQNLRELIKPISKKLNNISIELDITDIQVIVKLYTKLLKFKRKTFSTYLSYGTGLELKKILSDEKNLNSFLKEIEVLARLYTKELTRDFFTINVEYKTKTKYF